MCSDISRARTPLLPSPGCPALPGSLPCLWDRLPRQARGWAPRATLLSGARLSRYVCPRGWCVPHTDVSHRGSAELLQVSKTSYCVSERVLNWVLKTMPGLCRLLITQNQCGTRPSEQGTRWPQAETSPPAVTRQQSSMLLCFLFLKMNIFKQKSTSPRNITYLKY